MVHSGFGISVFTSFLTQFPMLWPHINGKYFVLVSLKCLFACLIVIWSFVLRCRGNKCPLIEGSWDGALHYCLVLTNRILQKLVITVMGRSEHATWVITSAPACLMVCYAEQRAPGACWGKTRQKAQRLIFFSNCLTYEQRAVTMLSTAKEATTQRNFSSPPPRPTWPMSMRCTLLHVVQKCSKVVWWW